MDFKLPFHVARQVIRDADGREVRLWGVNYYAPFNHNYTNLTDKGVDVLRAIDRDIADFKRLGVQLVRMHLFDREISDLDGNLVENDHLRAYDYLMDRLEENGIYVMITAMAWWNSTGTQNELRKLYAHCTMADLSAFGFANVTPKHMLIWHPLALARQERYLRALFAHKSRFSGRGLTDYQNIAAIEVLNEPDYPRPATMAALRAQRAAIERNPLRREELALLDLYDARRKAGAPDDEASQWALCADLVAAYIERMFGVVDEYFQGRVLKTHISYDFDVPAMRRMLMRATRIDCLSLAFYGGGFATTSSIPQRVMLQEAVHGRMARRYEEGDILGLGKALICYEWAIQCTLTAFDMPATAHLMAGLGVQLAAYFTYTPRDLGEYNPGWLQQYLSITHTPRRAVGFAAGGQVFRTTPRGTPCPEDALIWSDERFAANAETDLAFFEDEEIYIAAGDTSAPPRYAAHRRIACCGKNPLVWRDGNGSTFIERLSETELRMTVLPDQFYVNDPFWGKRYDGSGFPNRDIDVNHVPVVSRLREAGGWLRLALPGFESARIERPDGARVERGAGGALRADPGEYRIIASGTGAVEKRIYEQ